MSRDKASSVLEACRQALARLKKSEGKFTRLKKEELDPINETRSNKVVRALNFDEFIARDSFPPRLYKYCNKWLN